MNIRVAKSGIQKELGILRLVVERKHTMPILSCVRLEARDGKLWLSGTNMDMGIRTVCEVEIEEPGAICLPARKLFDIVSALPDGLVEFVGTGQRMTIRSGRSRFQIAGFAVADFPHIPAVSWNGHRVPTNQWALGTERVLFAVKWETGSVLSGVNFEWWDGGMRLVATDGHRLALWETATPPPERTAHVIPKEAMRILARLLDTEEMEVVTDANHVYVRAGHREFVSRLHAGNFPNYESVIPNSAPSRAIVSAEEFLEACRRVMIVADRQRPVVQLSFSEGAVTFTTQATGVDEGAVEEIWCSYEGEPMEIAFNAEYLEDFFSVVTGTSVEIWLRDARSQALFRPLQTTNESERYVYVLMPVLLPGASRRETE